jgi:hypothetical protein
MRYFLGSPPALKAAGVLAVLFLLAGLIAWAVHMAHMFSDRVPRSDTLLDFAFLLLIGVGLLLFGAYLWLAPEYQRGVHTVLHRDDKDARRVLIALIGGFYANIYGIAVLILPEGYTSFVGPLILIAFGVTIIIATSRFSRRPDAQTRPQE